MLLALGERGRSTHEKAPKATRMIDPKEMREDFETPIGISDLGSNRTLALHVAATASPPGLAAFSWRGSSGEDS
jgi:hypothetical protein